MSEPSRYALSLSDGEVTRYRFMASNARASESDLWATAGITAGAKVVDLGCGPGLVALELADVVGSGGRVAAIDREPDAAATAQALIAEAGLSQVQASEGEAWDTGLEAGVWDVVNLRHVLAHNTPDEVAQILAHVRSLLRPDGCVYIAESDLTATRSDPPDPDLTDMLDRYVGYLRSVGRNPAAGPALGSVLAASGFEVIARQAGYFMPPPSTSVRPPAWAAREAMCDAGFADHDDIARWDHALDRATKTRIAAFIAFHLVVARPT